MFTEKDIVKNVSSQSTIDRGVRLFKNDYVWDINTNETKKGFFINGLVQGSYDNEYNVQIRLDEPDGEIIDYSCDCPAFFSYGGMCKHCVAVALEYIEQRKTSEFSCSSPLASGLRPREVTTDEKILDIIEAVALRKRLDEQTACGNIELIPVLHEIHTYYHSNPDYILTFKIGASDGRKYVLKNLGDFLDHIRKEEMYSYGKQLSFVHSKHIFTKEAWEYIKMMTIINEQMSYSFESLGKELPLSADLWDVFYEINCGKTIEFESPNSNITALHFTKKELPVKLSLSENDDGSFSIKIPPLVFLSGRIKYYAIIKDILYPCSADVVSSAGYFFALADTKKESVYCIARKDMPAFCGSVLPELQKANVLTKTKLNLDEFKPKEAKITYYLDDENGRVTLKTTGTYGDETYNLLNPPSFANEYHDRTKELRAVNLGRSYFPNEDFSEKVLYFASDDDDRMYHLLNTGIGQLEEDGTVYATSAIKGKKLIHSPKAHIGIALKSGLLDLNVQSDAFSNNELSSILDSYQKKKKYYRMKNGNYIKLEDNALSTLTELLDGLGLSAKDLADENIEVPKYRACYIDQILRKKDAALHVDRNADYKAIIRDMKNVEDSDYSVPLSLSQTLREYQKTGFRWLNTLAHLGFGGILADDMGLGKTLQMIAYLLYRKQTDAVHLPHLIICPASLVYNWKRELNRFAPELKVNVITGNAAQRESLITNDKNSNVWITSYDMIKRDLRLYADCHFDTEVIDEAQNIKNHGTQAAKAVKKIQADIRFALTGTPIENRLSELWSIFDFLMPGILGTYEKFRNCYELPIVQNQDAQITDRLKKMIAPFILRRIKNEVLKELPEKIEQVVYTNMEPEQRKIYEAHAIQLMNTLKNQSTEDVQKDKLQILAELTKLRQICCAPQILYENYKETACKLDACMELVHQAISGNHKVLIFSQFTSIFPILEKRLRQEKISHYKLTGQTSKEERILLVEKFNSDDVPVFLISLKAGGTGLNLTAANIVIHFDPWWNLAAQNQATDRAHRFGQDKQVIVFKLIAQNTIEDKIIELQESKYKLAQQILDGQGTSISTMTKDDFMEILKF